MKSYLTFFSLFNTSKVKIDCEILKETDKAFLIEIVGVKKLWVAKSICKIVKRDGQNAVIKLDKHLL